MTTPPPRQGPVDGAEASRQNSGPARGGEELAAVLKSTDLRTTDLADGIGAVRSETEAVSDGIDDVLHDLWRLDAAPLDPVGETEAFVQQRSPRVPAATPTRDWSALVQEAHRDLIRRGVDPATVALDDLLDPEEIRAIERRFHGAFRVKTAVDRYDLTVAVGAGIVAGFVDFFIVQTPAEMHRLGIPGSPVTRALRNHSVPHDNWLARRAKVSYDHAGAERADLNAPRTHRLHSLGHDPLIGLVVGTIDLLRGGLTAIDGSGRPTVISDLASPVPNPLTAFTTALLHLLSDAFTPAGLPPPAWFATQFLQGGSVQLGGEERTLAEVARWMYQDGYDLRHTIVGAAAPASAALILRGYYRLRRELDPVYAEETAVEATHSAAERPQDHPRYLTLSLIANSIGAAANAGKVMLFAPPGLANPAAFNYATWASFGLSVLRWARPRLRSPSEVLADVGWRNLRVLADGWVAAPPDDDFPDLPAAMSRLGIMADQDDDKGQT